MIGPSATMSKIHSSDLRNEAWNVAQKNRKSSNSGLYYDLFSVCGRHTHCSLLRIITIEELRVLRNTANVRIEKT